MHLRIKVRPILPGSTWSDVDPEKPIRLPIGGGQIQITADPTRRISLRRVHNEGSVTMSLPCELECRSGTESEQLLEALLEDGTVETLQVCEGAGENFGAEVLRDVADFGERLQAWFDSTDKTVDALYDALRTGRLTLLTRTNPLSGLSVDYGFDELLDGFPSLVSICVRPRLHLHIEEAVRPIALVRRSGPAAIRHLACHSEHWEARTVSGLRPARLLAHVVEDDWQLYENRFVLTLLRRLRKYLRSAWQDIDSRYQQASGSIDLFSISDFALQRHPRALSYLLPDVRKDQIEDSWLVLRELHDKVVTLFKGYQFCRKSKFYQRLQKCLDVQAPILNTNILVMDRRYRRARQLWDVIQKRENVPQRGPDGALPADFTAAFLDFCQVITMVALDVSGFTSINPEVALAGPDGSRFQVQGAYRHDNWTIVPKMEEASGSIPWLRIQWRRSIPTKFAFRTERRPGLHVVRDRYEIVSDGIVYYDRLTAAEINEIKRMALTNENRHHRQQWAKFVDDTSRQAAPVCTADVGLVPVFSKIVPSSRHLDGLIADLLDHLVRFGVEHQLRSAYALLPVAFSESDETSVASDRVVRRLLNYGDRYDTEDAIRWGGYRAGTIPVARDQFASLSRIAQLINYQTARFNAENSFPMSACPLCAGNAFAEDDGVFTCRTRTCQAVWLYASCFRCRNRYITIRRPSVSSARASKLEGSFLAAMLASEETSDPRTGAAPQPFFCKNGAFNNSVAICPFCGSCSDSDHCQFSCLYRSSLGETLR